MSQHPCSAAAEHAAANSPAPELSVAEFRDQLDHYLSQVEGLKSGGAAVQEFRRSLPASWIVRDAGQRFEIATARIQASLDLLEKSGKSPEPAVREIHEQLFALRQEVAGEASASNIEAEEVSSRLKDILSRREFRGVQPETAMQRAKKWLLDQVLRALSYALGKIPMDSISGQVLIWVLIAIVFIFLALLLRRTLQSSMRDTSMQLGPAPAPAMGWREWIREAQAAALRGDYRAALHAAYWSAVSRLEERGAWAKDRSRTPREYLRLLDPRCAELPAMSALTSRFEITWYGYRAAAPEDFHEALQHLEALGCQLPSTLATARS